MTNTLQKSRREHQKKYYQKHKEEFDIIRKINWHKKKIREFKEELKKIKQEVKNGKNTNKK